MELSRLSPMAIHARNCDLKPFIRRVLKVAFFILLLIIVGRCMVDPFYWLNYDFVLNVGHLMYGIGEVGAENIDDTYFYIDFIISITTTTAIYLLMVILIKKIRSK